MTIDEQINDCLHKLNVLHDMIVEQRQENFDLSWQLDQVENAKVCIRRLYDDC